MTAQAPQVAEGWIVSAETVNIVGGVEIGRSAQFWLAMYSDASAAVAAVEAASGLIGGAHVEARAKASPSLIQRLNAQAGQVIRLAP